LNFSLSNLLILEKKIDSNPKSANSAAFAYEWPNASIIQPTLGLIPNSFLRNS
jgi:hypothetical protein